MWLARRLGQLTERDREVFKRLLRMLPMGIRVAIIYAAAYYCIHHIKKQPVHDSRPVPVIR
jgi:hypothetical protein